MVYFNSKWVLFECTSPSLRNLYWSMCCVKPCVLSTHLWRVSWLTSLQHYQLRSELLSSHVHYFLQFRTEYYKKESKMNGRDGTLHAACATTSNGFRFIDNCERHCDPVLSGRTVCIWLKPDDKTEICMCFCVVEVDVLW